MFEWNSKKARHNQLKHRVSFEEASTAFLDPDGLDGKDMEHSSRSSPIAIGKERVGQSTGHRLYYKETWP